MILYLFLISILIIVVILFHAFEIYVISDIYNKRDKIISKQLFLTLSKYMGIYLITLFFFWIISNFLYKTLYIIGFAYLGYLLHISIFCCFYLLISKFKNIPPLYSKILIFIIPLIITIYSIINAQKVVFQEETLIYPGYNHSIKIMHLTDMHLGAIYQKGSVENIVNSIIEKDPNVVVITGDLSDGSKKVEIEWLEPFNKIPENITVLYVTGNHEFLYGKNDILSQIYKVQKIKHIGNTGEIYNIKGVSFIGLDYEYKDAATKAKSILNKYGTNEIKNPVVLLYHIPKISLKNLNEIGIFLMMSGHTHKGQFFPFTVLSWIGNKYFCGLYNNENKNYVFVSSGYGTALIPMRIFSSKMIGIITIKGN